MRAQRLPRYCPGCQHGGVRTVISNNKYLCLPDWNQLMPETQQRLYIKDGRAIERAMVLIDQIQNHVPLDCIVVPE